MAKSIQKLICVSIVLLFASTLFTINVTYSYTKNILTKPMKTSICVNPEPETGEIERFREMPEKAVNADPPKNENLTMVYVVTPTFLKPTQIAELTALANTLRNVQNVTWIVVEDSQQHTEAISTFLKKQGIPYVHLTGPMPENERKREYLHIPRGAANRNSALQWIRLNIKKGVVYFADDDNTYDPLLFDQIRETKMISMFPVGLVTEFMLTTPVVRNGTIVEFYDGWNIRKYAVDMAEFAVNIEFLLTRPKAYFVHEAGWQETAFLKMLEPFDFKDIQPMANNCTQLLAFHTKSEGT